MTARSVDTSAETAASDPRRAVTQPGHTTRRRRLRQWLDRSRLRRRIAGLAVAGVLATTTTLATAGPAQAWIGNPNVTAWGYASCHSVYNALDVPAKAVWMYVYATGETEQVNVDWTEFWDAHFHTIPSGGSWAAPWEYCALPGVTPGWRFSRYVWLSRPWVTSWEGPIDTSA